MNDRNTASPSPLHATDNGAGRGAGAPAGGVANGAVGEPLVERGYGADVRLRFPHDSYPTVFTDRRGFMFVTTDRETLERLVDDGAKFLQPAAEPRPTDAEVAVDPLADADLFAQGLIDRIGRMGWESRQDDPQCYKVLDAASAVLTAIQKLREELRYWKPAQETPPRGGSRADGPMFPPTLARRIEIENEPSKRLSYNVWVTDRNGASFGAHFTDFEAVLEYLRQIELEPEDGCHEG